jgi:hypothetical protein
LIPKHVLDQVITNFPSELWFREIRREDFNAPSEMAPASLSSAHAVSAREREAEQLAEALGRSGRDEDAQQDREPKVAA